MTGEPNQPENPITPEVLPVLPLKGVVVFPAAVVPLAVAQERSIKIVEEIMGGNHLMVVVAQRSENVEAARLDDLYSIGTVVAVHRVVRQSDSSLQLIVQGLERVRLIELVSTEPYLSARVQPMPAVLVVGLEVAALQRAVTETFRKLVPLVEGMNPEAAVAIESLPDPEHVANMVASVAPLEIEQRQEVLEMDALDAKLRRLLEILQHEVAVRELGRQIATNTQERMSKAQREYVLREQLRTIQKEIGEGDDTPDLADLRQRIESAGLPEEAKKEAERELSRLMTIQPASPEHGMIRSYLEWMADLPWKVHTGVAIDLTKAREVLDVDHYDLDKVKERIVEHLAVQKLRAERHPTFSEISPEAAERATLRPGDDGTPHAPILCFVGPPGVGKTSLGQSIARALGRKFVRMSLGGIRDEAEIRGHRRTYIGSMPGRILQGIRRAGARDPVFMLDEIDKVGADWRGDPSSALLEVLDPAQNHSFVDNYLGVGFDLSSVFFITTANTVETIPPPLLDRMEVLSLSGYTEREKIFIARGYLVPNQVRAHGLTEEEIAFDDEAIRRIVQDYTREAGVRNLDRQIATVCRKVATLLVGGTGLGSKTRVDAAMVETLLGKPLFHEEAAQRIDRPGVANGLAWTPAGGDLLTIEATLMPSNEERLILTGMMGDVMRESAQAALSYLRSNAQQLGLSSSVFKGKAVHIHVPAGAIPKDGPSAGVTMAAALASLVGDQLIRSDVAMTGEITLRGRVLPVGGIKEKVLAAHRNGIRTVILPERNGRDLDDVPAEVRQEMSFILVDTADDVIKHALSAVEEPMHEPVGVV